MPGKLVSKYGFTLIELLIVIVIVGILTALIAVNLFSARERALDSQRKSNMKEFKTALQLYFVDYHQYPASSGDNTSINGCGPSGTSACPVCTSFYFASGGADGCQRVYAKKLEMSSGGSLSNIRYYQCTGGDDYRLKTSLTNTSDADIADSQKRCPVGCGTTYTATDFVLCNN